MKETNTKIKNFIINVTKEIGKYQLDNFSYTKKLKGKAKSKYFSDVLTKVDKISEKILIQKAKKIGFKGKILAEEMGKINLGNSNQRLIIDPLDGSYFYSRGIPNFCVAIALEENDKIIYATVYNPITKELFFAEKGKGAFLNGKKIKVSKTKDLIKSTIILSAYPHYEIGTIEKIFTRLMNSVGLTLLLHLVNMNLCYIADGKYDGIIGYYSILPEWDKLPGVFILEEAGGLITDINGKKWNKSTTKFIASNKILHKNLLTFCND